ncbi:hypothetical protein GCM10023339_10010 [Alloalcanivorax gelatiniphagus]
MERVTAPTYEFRRLVDSDAEASRRLGREAFGHPAPPPGIPAPLPRPGATRWGVFLGEQLVGRVEGYEFGSWFGGRVLPTVGVGAVTIAAEHRGRGLSRGLIAQVLDDHRSRGAAVSTLFPTAPGYYRGYGYEVIGSFDEVVLPSSSLAGLPRPSPDLRVRRATSADASAVRELYDAWAAGQNGPCDRRGPALATGDDGWIEGHDAVTLVEDARGTLLGFASWDRGPGSGAGSYVSVTDLVATGAEAHQALWSVLGSFSAVVEEVRLLTSGPDVARYSLPASTWRVSVEDTYMLRVEDVAQAVTGISVPFETSVPFSVAGDPLGVIDGTYLLTTEDGAAQCRPTTEGPRGPIFSPRGLALCVAGTQSCANLRRAGLLDGPAAWDDSIDHVFGGRQVHVRDYF